MFIRKSQIMDRIDQLRVFLRIKESGSFALAADQLGLPRATVSQALRQLEERLGVRLFHRTTRQVSLTQDGEALAERAAALVADMAELEQQFRPQDDLVSGRLRVDVPSRIARRLLAPALPGFLARYPQLQVELGSSDRMVDLVREGVDCALRVGDVQNDSLVARPLGYFAMVNCASPVYLAAQGVPANMDDMARQVMVGYVSRSSGRQARWCWQEGDVERSMPLQVRASADNAETYIACALAGLGLIQVPRYDVAHHLASGVLQEVLPLARPAPLPVHLVYPHRRQLSRRVQLFHGWVQSVLQQRTDAMWPPAQP